MPWESAPRVWIRLSAVTTTWPPAPMLLWLWAKRPSERSPAVVTVPTDFPDADGGERVTATSEAVPPTPARLWA